MPHSLVGVLRRGRHRRDGVALAVSPAGRRRQPRGPTTIAVLPFENLGPAEDEYFPAGMTDEITQPSGRGERLGVVSRRAAERYARTDMTMREIGRELGVDYLLIGSVRWADGRTGSRNVRVTLELLQAAGRAPALVDDLRSGDRRHLRGAVGHRGAGGATGSASRRPRTSGTGCAPGRPRITRPTRCTSRAGISGTSARRRTSRPRSTTSSRRWTWIPVTPSRGSGSPTPGSFAAGTASWRRGTRSRRRRHAALKALEFDSTLAEAHASLAHIHLEFDHDWDAAEREYRRAIQLEPRYPTAHHWYGGFLSAMGRHEEALQTGGDGPGPRSALAHHPDLGRPALLLRRESTTPRSPSTARRWSWTAISRPRTGTSAGRTRQPGSSTKAVAEAERAVAIDGSNLLYLASLGHAYAQGGEDEGGARHARAAGAGIEDAACLGVSRRRRSMSRSENSSAALDWLERAYEEQSAWIGYMKVDPRLDPVRTQPRFQRLLGRTAARFLSGVNSPWSCAFSPARRWSDTTPSASRSVSRSRILWRPQRCSRPRFAAILRLGFSDIVAVQCAEDVLFSPEHATAIVEFVERWRHADRLVVHCHAGLSRSPGVALGLCDRYGWPVDAVEADYPYWNRWVRRVLVDNQPGSSHGSE